MLCKTVISLQCFRTHSQHQTDSVSTFCNTFTAQQWFHFSVLHHIHDNTTVVLFQHSATHSQHHSDEGSQLFMSGNSCYAHCNFQISFLQTEQDTTSTFKNRYRITWRLMHACQNNFKYETHQLMNQQFQEFCLPVIVMWARTSIKGEQGAKGVSCRSKTFTGHFLMDIFFTPLWSISKTFLPWCGVRKNSPAQCVWRSLLP